MRVHHGARADAHAACHTSICKTSLWSMARSRFPVASCVGLTSIKRVCGPAGEKKRKAGGARASPDGKQDRQAQALAGHTTHESHDRHEEAGRTRTSRTLLAQRSSVRLGAERAGAISERRGSVRNFSAARWASRMYIVLGRWGGGAGPGRAGSDGARLDDFVPAASGDA